MAELSRPSPARLIVLTDPAELDPHATPPNSEGEPTPDPAPPEGEPVRETPPTPELILEDEEPSPEAPEEEGLAGEEPDESDEEVDGLALAPASVRPALEQRGFRELSKVQLAVVAADGASRDLQISSQTGSGKTVALGFAMADVLAQAGPHAGRGDGPTALVLVPTRELAGQVGRELEWLYAGLQGVRVTVVTGGTNVGFEVRRLAKGPRVVVGTPGRVLDHVTSGALDLSDLKEVVLDEADQMLDLGFRDELEAILDATPTERRTHLVSATFSRGILQIAEQYQKDPLHIEGTRLGEANADIEHLAFLVREQDRYAALLNLLLLQDDKSVLVFVNTRADATDIAEALSRDGFTSVPLSGELAQSQRTRTLESFRAGAVRVLVATDVAARGLDIPDVGVVLHAATPRDAETYTHRSGRTGRAGSKGRCLLMVPTRRERHVRRLLSEARVESSWRDIPTAERVLAALEERERVRLLEAVETKADPGTRPLELADELLGGRDPREVVARLLGLVPSPLRCQPLQLEVPQPWSRKKHKDGKWQRRDDRYGRRDDRGGSQKSYGRSYDDRDDRRYGSRQSYGDDRRSNDRPWESQRDDRGPRRDRQHDEGGHRGYDDRRQTHRSGRDHAGRDHHGRERYGRDRYDQGRPDNRPDNRSYERGPRQDDRPRHGSRERDRGFQDDGPRPERPYSRNFERKDDRGGHRGYDRDDRQRGYEDRRHGRNDRRPARGDRGPESGFQRYEVNWGGRDGANPRRVLAMVCRRGGCQGRDVGAIRIDANATTFEVSERIAREFEDRVRTPDPRDPHLKIRRARR